MGFWAALQFLTIFPTPLRHEVPAGTSGQSLPYFPLVGLILGAILLGLHYGLSLILPSSVVTALLITALVILTGAHHLDGLIDTCDGVFAGKSKRERLAIMSDTRVGAFGIVGVVLLLLLKYVSLFSVSTILPALLLMPTLSRWAMVSIIFVFPYAKSSGMGLPFKQGATWQRLTVATIIALIVAVAMLKWWGLALMAVLWLSAFGTASYFRSRLGGLTGDNYGAINEISEVLVLLLIILIGRLQ
ncbi:MAG: adenosylcobinamide-GDP ribazoletransferase [Dehalococcoidia bacterium]|nr:adenosylcobinamide-GDP ribazoletransferase [Dehalococcoidia bacterium]